MSHKRGEKVFISILIAQENKTSKENSQISDCLSRTRKLTLNRNNKHDIYCFKMKCVNET
jgi:hypothetical protein